MLGKNMRSLGTRLELAIESFCFKHRLITRKCTIRGAAFRVYSWHPKPWRIPDVFPLSWILDRTVKDEIIFDIGANRGYYAMAVKAVHPSVRIHAFEPSHSIAGKLRQNIDLNGWAGDIRVLELAAGERSERLVLNEALKDAATSLCPDHASLNGRVITALNECRVESLDSLIGNGEVPEPTFIKIDTEGYEKPILRGAMKCLRRTHPKLCIESHPLKPGDGTVEGIREVLENLGYTMIRQEDRFFYCE